MAKELTEDELNLRRKARRRLIGAIALTLAVVVILPMVLDSEPKPGGQDIDLRIPAPGNAGMFMPGVAGMPAAGSAVAPSSTGAPAAANTVSQAAAPGKQPETAPASKKEALSKVPATGKSSVSKSAAKPASEDGFVVQVGAYSNAAAAKQELDKLKKWGFIKAYTEKSGDKMRVRVGPYAERAKAEKVLQLLEKHGLNFLDSGVSSGLDTCFEDIHNLPGKVFRNGAVAPANLHCSPVNCIRNPVGIERDHRSGAFYHVFNGAHSASIKPLS